MSEPQWNWQVEEVFHSATGAGKPILQRVLGQLDKMEYSEHDRYSIHMAFEEALVNAIKHGNRLDPAKKVHVLCKMSHHLVHIEVEDEGPGFDPGDVPDPTLPENIELPNGRGIMLMRCFMSKVEYNESGNRVILEKERTPA